MINRNDPCWCGSGKKYKKCHLGLESDAPQPRLKPKYLKTPVEVTGMRRAGAFNGELMDYIRPFVKAGTTTLRDQCACS